MATSTQQAGSTGDPGPTVFVLFGATGDLAKRMVLPAFYRLAQEGLLPPQWRLGGDGPRGGGAFPEHVFFAGGGFSTDDPGGLLDVIGKARHSLGTDPQLVHYLAVP